MIKLQNISQNESKVPLGWEGVGSGCEGWVDKIIKSGKDVGVLWVVDSIGEIAELNRGRNVRIDEFLQPDIADHDASGICNPHAFKGQLIDPIFADNIEGHSFERARVIIKGNDSIVIPQHTQTRAGQSLGNLWNIIKDYPKIPVCCEIEGLVVHLVVLVGISVKKLPATDHPKVGSTCSSIISVDTGVDVLNWVAVVVPAVDGRVKGSDDVGTDDWDWDLRVFH